MDIKLKLALSWIIIGFISLIIMLVLDMRGNEFDKDYFKESGTIEACLTITILGWISPLLLIGIILHDSINNGELSRLIYNIVNIGTGKKAKQIVNVRCANTEVKASTHGIVSSIKVNVNDTVDKDNIILTIKTDDNNKVNIESPRSGKIIDIVTYVDAPVVSGETLIIIE